MVLQQYRSEKQRRIPQFSKEPYLVSNLAGTDHAPLEGWGKLYLQVYYNLIIDISIRKIANAGDIATQYSILSIFYKPPKPPLTYHPIHPPF